MAERTVDVRPGRVRLLALTGGAMEVGDPASMAVALLEAAPDAIVGVAADGSIAMVNAQTVRLFGYDRGEMLGQPVEMLVPERVRGLHPAHRGAYLGDPHPRPMGAGMRLAARRKDGTEFPAEISLSPVASDDVRFVAAVVRDASDWARAEAKFHSLLEAAPDAIVCVAADGTIAMANAQTVRLFGYDRHELVGQPVELLVPERVRGMHPGHRAKYVTDPHPRPMGAGMRLAARRKDGTEFSAEISLSSIETEDGTLVAASIRDVTQQRTLQAISDQLAAIVESSHDAIIGMTLAGLITSWNPAAERIYGYAAAEMIGQYEERLYPEHLLDRESRVLLRIARGEQVGQYRTERRRKDGSTLRVAVTASPISNAAGVIIGAAAISRDITAQEQADARFIGLLEAAPDAIVGVDTDGSIALVNAQAVRLFGYSREELVGQPIEILVPNRARAAHPSHRNSYIADPVPRPMGARMQLSARRKDGSEFPVEISLSSIGTGSERIVSAAIRDITERLQVQAEQEQLRAHAEQERLQARLQHSQRLESLGQLAGGVAHDFNNLLAVMLNYTSFVEQEITSLATHLAADNPVLSEQCSTLLNDIAQVDRAGQRATDLTRQLLAFGRRDVVRPVVLNLNTVLAEVHQLLERTLGEHIELYTQHTADLWPIVADAGQLEQVLVNLAVNARDAMPDGGILRIDTANLRLSELDDPDLPPGRYVKLCVADTGTGIPPEVVERVFEPFYTTKPKGKGTGLGLATVYGIITRAGGTIRIHSTPGAGTTMTVLLPATDAASADTATAPVAVKPTHHRGGETILLVEDQDALREITRRILDRNGYQVLVAADGPEAIKVAGEHHAPIHLLLTDVVMPRMLGRDVATQLTAARPDIRTLYMSGYAQPVLASQGNLDPDVVLLEKPFTEADLLGHVALVLQR
jgi:PAS domain S-box-containing protein